MKNQNKKYLLVDASQIEVVIRKLKKYHAFNESWVSYIPTETLSTKTIFDKYNIPDNFQKIAFSFPNPLNRKSAEEVLTKRAFKIKRSPLEKTYHGEDKPRTFNSNYIPTSIFFKTENKKISYEKITDFYESVTENGYLENYVDALKKIMYVDKHEMTKNKLKVAERIKQYIKKTS